MNGVNHNDKNESFEKAYSGCLGRMVNLFELNLGVTANRLLTDKPHRDGSPLARSRSDVSRMSPSGDQMEEKMVVTEFKNTSSNRKSNGTPMKMLIAQEMSKDVDSRRSPPNLVAKLMGLDALPPPNPDPATMIKGHSRGHPRSQSDIPLSYWEQQNGCFHYVDPPNEYKDVHEIWQRSPKSPHKARHDETTNKKRMALVRQKFDEAKHLSMDVKLRQSKQFQDALEVLNSNKDLFIKCLQEPNAMFSENLHSLQALPPPLETKRITVLKPSKIADNIKYSGDGNKDVKQMTTGALVQLNGSENIHLGSSNRENPSQPTRIVVLKPSLGKPHDLKAAGSPQSESPRILNGEDFTGDVGEDENQESREVAKAITQQMREKLGRHRRDETLISSVFSNGYIGDESSFNKSEMDYDAGNLSDSEVISPISRHSWDYVNRLGSPYSSSSFSRASFSPESSVCREAKKRLSERWAMMASNGSYAEQRHVRRSSSTLGEMLALSETKKPAVLVEDGVSSEESKDVNSAIVREQISGDNLDNSPRNLTRSKSVPVSSIEFGSRLNMEISASDDGIAEVPKEERKAKSSKSSFKGKVSNLFFSRNKKVSKDKSIASETKHQIDSPSRDLGCNGPECVSGKGSNHLSLGVMETSSNASFWNLIDKRSAQENGLFMPKSIASGNPGENQDQPSPISVLDLPFEEDIETSKFLSHMRSERQEAELQLNSLRSNLIDKSPPIGSIARTLSWDESCVDTASSYPVKESLTAHGTEEEEQELYFFVKTLLSVAGLGDEVQSNSSYMNRWHSPDSPLDPSLRETYIDLKDKETLHEAKRRQKRSNRKLIFDCVNVALLEISGYGSGSGQRPTMSSRLDHESTLLDEVWDRLTVWFSGDRCVSDNGDDGNLVVERVIRKEVMGRVWENNLRTDVDALGREIEGDLLEELVQETVAEFAGKT